MLLLPLLLLPSGFCFLDQVLDASLRALLKLDSVQHGHPCCYLIVLGTFVIRGVVIRAGDNKSLWQTLAGTEISKIGIFLQNLKVRVGFIFAMHRALVLGMKSEVESSALFALGFSVGRQELVCECLWSP